jgi:hypothetical protein
MPMSISSPKCQCRTPRQTTNVNPFVKMHYPRAPHSFSVSLPPCRPQSKLSNPWNPTHTQTMMPFNCSYRNKNEPSAIYPSLHLEYFVRCTSDRVSAFGGASGAETQGARVAAGESSSAARILPQRLVVCDRLLPLMLDLKAANTQTKTQLHLSYGLELVAALS